MRTYEYRHIVTFEDTNVIGNVYYVNHLRWQGRCRELFLRENARAVFDRLGRDLFLVTTRCECEYLDELTPHDEVLVRMHLTELVQNRITMGFEYFRVNGDGDDKGGAQPEELVARGEQQVAAMVRHGEGFMPMPLPDELRKVLEEYLPS